MEEVEKSLLSAALSSGGKRDDYLFGSKMMCEVRDRANVVDDDGWFQPAGDDRGRGMWWSCCCRATREEELGDDGRLDGSEPEQAGSVEEV